MKKCSIPRAVREMQSKTTRDHITAAAQLRPKRQMITSPDSDEEKLEASYIAGGNSLASQKVEAKQPQCPFLEDWVGKTGRNVQTQYLYIEICEFGLKRGASHRPQRG